MSFSNVFGGGSLQPSSVAYRAFTLTANLALVWPSQSTTGTDFAARTMDVTCNTPGLTLTMPPANAVSAGYDLLLSNKGNQAFTIAGNLGGVIATLSPGQTKYIQVIDNSTQAGGWGVILFGATSSAIDAASLAGLGLSASGAQIQAARPTVTFSASGSIGPTDRAKMYVWTGGVGTQTLPLSSTVGTDFFYELKNQGTGVLTLAISGGDTIDGASSITLQPSDSCLVHSSGLGPWYTVGRGRNPSFPFTYLSKGVTGGAVSLSSTEAANVVQKYSGTLISNCTVTLPSVVQIYYVQNATAGAFSLTFKCGGGATVAVPQGQNAILFADGTNIVNTSTTVAGIGSLTLSQGSVSAPSFAYSGDTSTGIYQPTSGQVAIALTGVQKGLWTSTGLGIGGTPTADLDVLHSGGTVNAYLRAAGGFTANLDLVGNGLVAGTTSFTLQQDSTGVAYVYQRNNANLNFGTNNTLRAILDNLGNFGLGTGANAINSKLNLRTDAGDGPMLMLENRVVNAGNHKFGSIVFSPYRDVADPAYGAALWAEGVSPAGYTADLVFGTSSSGAASTFPTEWFRITSGGLVKIPAGGLFGIGVTPAHPIHVQVQDDQAAILALSGATGHYVGMGVGRASLEGVLGMAGLANNFFNGTSPGDTVLTSIAGNLWLGGTGGNAVAFATNNTLRYQITGAGVLQDAAGNAMGWRDLPAASTTAGTLAATDAGKCSFATGTITVPNATFAQGQIVLVQDTTGTGVTISQAAGIATMRLSGTTSTGNRTVKPWGMARIFFLSGTACTVGGDVT